MSIRDIYVCYYCSCVACSCVLQCVFLCVAMRVPVCFQTPFPRFSLFVVSLY